MKRTSKDWYDGYVKWGGCIQILDPDGWDRKNWQHSWFEEKIFPEEFLRRAMWSTLMNFFAPDTNIAKKCGSLTDMEYYFTCVVREGDDCELK